jgi:hypothetical protein
MKTFYIIFTFCMGLFAGYVLFNKENQTFKPPLEPFETIATKAAAIGQSKDSAFEKLKRHNDFLQGQLAIVSVKLKQNKSSLYSERKKLSQIQEAISADTICNNKILTDSLNQSISSIHSVTDSLVSDYEYKILIGETKCAVRDSEIVICNKAYSGLKDLVKEQAMREQQLTESLNEALKQQRRKRLQSRFLTAGMLFVTGLATSFIIDSKQ